MTNPDYTALAMLIDRSGSMVQTREDAIGGMAQFLKEQREVPGKCTVRISQFDNQYEVVCESTPVADVPDPDLVPRGSTALLDAWGRLMTEFGEELAALPEEERPENVIFVVITDGQENASREWTRDKLFEAVTEQTDKWGWKFAYLGADQDAVTVGGSYGVAAGQTMSYTNDSAGTQAAYAATSRMVTNTRSGKKDADLNDS